MARQSAKVRSTSKVVATKPGCAPLHAMYQAQRYKCRVRTPWYAVPLPKRRADAFLPYMFHLGPRLVVNKVGARSTNLLHGVSLKEGAPPAASLAVAMASSLTLLSAEVEGRAYGGGVLKLETREAERLLVPDITGLVADRLPAIFHSTDELIRTGDIRSAARSVDEIFGLDHDAWNDSRDHLRVAPPVKLVGFRRLTTQTHDNRALTLI